jgi:electron transport complex protein RnfC
MSLGLEGLPGSGTFPHGIHPPDRKNFSSDVPIEVIPSAKSVLLPLMQNVGAPCAPVVKARQMVVYGEMVADAQAFVSAPLHSPINGKVLKTGVTTLPNGRHVPAIPIEAEGEQISARELWEDTYGGNWLNADLNNVDPAKIGAAIRAAGIVGQGGAAFPTHVKFAKNEKKPIEALLVNGCECEPYLTTDYRLMIEAPEAIIAGALLAARAVGADTVAIGVEDNKPKAIESLKAAASGTSVKVCVVHTKYPQGSEKQMIKALVGREVPVGGLPMDVGVAVTNVGTAAAVARAVLRGKPLTHRVVCVTGAGINQPKNLLVPIGIALGELIDFCGGLKPDAARLVAGGPMMGFAFADLEMPVTKGTSGITVLTDADVRKAEETACIRCGRCVDACPMKLVPTKLALACRHKDLELAERYHIMACFECGCCAYVCPANLPIVQLVRTGKALVMARR